MGSRKKRLPNSTTAFVRKDALPLGTFTKYTWSINNVLHVKQIFDTPHLPLEVTRYGSLNFYEVQPVIISEPLLRTKMVVLASTILL